MANNSEFMLRSEGGFFTDELKFTFFMTKVCPKHLVCGKEFESNYSAFYRIYKKFFGISPKEDMKYYKENKKFYKTDDH